MSITYILWRKPLGVAYVPCMRSLVLLLLTTAVLTACEPDTAKLHRLEQANAAAQLALVSAECPDSLTAPAPTPTTPDTAGAAPTVAASTAPACHRASPDSIAAARDRATLAARDLNAFLTGR